MATHQFPNFFQPMSVFPAWLNAASRANRSAFTIATQSQQVVALRMQMMMTPTTQPEKNVDEMARMVTEKLAATKESSKAFFQLWSTMLAAMPTAFTDPNTAERMLNEAAETADKALAPYATRVSANVKRLSH